MRISLSPLRYPGGKGVLGPFLANLITSNGLLGCSYYELYAGGCGAGLYLLENGIVKDITINDADFRINAFWYAILFETEKFLKRLDDININIDEWHRQQKVYINAANEEKFDVGFATFFLNRTNRSGILFKSGPIGGFNQTGKYLIDARFNKTNLRDRVNKILLKADKIKISNTTAETFIESYENLIGDNSFVYLDPPYYKQGGKLYLNNYDHQQHAELAKLLSKNSDKKWLVSYDNVNEIKLLYQTFKMSSFNLNYSLQDKKHGSELLIFSDSIKVPDTIKLKKKKHELFVEQPIIQEK